MAVAVKLSCEDFFSQRHTNSVSNTLTQRTSGSFNARRVATLRVTGGFGVQLTELFQFVHRQVIAAKAQQRINQHRTVAVGRHKAGAISPIRVPWVMFEEIV